MFKLKNRKAVAMLFTFLIIFALTAATVGFVYLSKMQARQSKYDVDTAQALWIAEAGIQQAIYNIRNDGSFRAQIGDINSPAYVNATLAGGSFSVTVYQLSAPAGNQVTLNMISTGTVGSVQRVASQTMLVDTTHAFSYAAHAFGTHVDFQDSTGEINGDLAAINFIKNYDDMTVNGTITQQSGQANPAPVDMNAYAGIADSIEGPGFKFDKNTTYGAPGAELIWYIQGNVNIESNVIIYGTVVAEGNISLMQNENFTIDSASGYPALLAGNNIKGDGLTNASMSGVIYADNNIDLDSTANVTIFGSVVSDNNTHLRYGTNLILNHDPDLDDNPPPYFSGEGALTPSVSPQKDWAESGPAG